MKIIFAQGNPEPKYLATRHNIGFSTVDAIANKFDAKWLNQLKFNAFVAEAQIAGEKVLLVKPATYYNETGMSARKIIDFYKIDPANDLLVIHDDLSLPFGTIRVRQQGSDGGNNGIKSINSYIGQDYWRIRVGTYNELRDKMDDADFVLSKFSAEESTSVKEIIIPHIFELVEQFCLGKIATTSYKISE
jgi:PTH1 family peptidyl-tRNA hydrolase